MKLFSFMLTEVIFRLVVFRNRFNKDKVTITDAIAKINAIQTLQKNVKIKKKKLNIF